MRITATRLAAAALAAAIVSAVPAWGATQEGVAATWVPKHVTFVYQGFTTRYSCDGLRDEIVRLLSRMGPKDLKVREQPCSMGAGVPSPFPGVTVHMQVLVPADKANAKNAGPTVQAHWHKVVLMPSNAGINEQGNCELIEQFKETFLPLFTTRHIDYESTCIPYQFTLGTHLSAEVLMPNKKTG
jgi:hypothetical protein